METGPENYEHRKSGGEREEEEKKDMIIEKEEDQEQQYIEKEFLSDNGSFRSSILSIDEDAVAGLIEKGEGGTQANGSDGALIVEGASTNAVIGYNDDDNDMKQPANATYLHDNDDTMKANGTPAIRTPTVNVVKGTNGTYDRFVSPTSQSYEPQPNFNGTTSTYGNYPKNGTRKSTNLSNNEMYVNRDIGNGNDNNNDGDKKRETLHRQNQHVQQQQGFSLDQHLQQQQQLLQKSPQEENGGQRGGRNRNKRATNDDADSDNDSDIEVVEIVQSKKNSLPQHHERQYSGMKQESSNEHPQYRHYHNQHNHQQHQRHQNHQHQHQEQYQHQMNQYHHIQQFMINQMQQKNLSYNRAFYTKISSQMKGFVPTWENPVPKNPAAIARSHPSSHGNQIRAYKLTLYSQTEFAITAVHHHSNDWRYVPTLQGLRKAIKEITKHYSNGEKAVFQDDSTPSTSSSAENGTTIVSNGGGKWRIPLSSYQAFLSYLRSDPMVRVQAIPQNQLKIASIGRAVTSRSYPSAKKIMDWGVPSGLAHSLAPYQRGGVDFVLEKNGRALIADDMGLGKTVQSIAAMCCYIEEWPLLVLTPSTARYHWEAEFMQWLGKENQQKKIEESADINGHHDENSATESEEWSQKRKSSSDMTPQAKKQRPSHNIKALLRKNEINVLSSSKDVILSSNTRVVICSYGLIATLVRKGAITRGQFNCIIVDESHMLKNKSSKRTIALLPILQDAKRVVLLSGTPALAKPIELYPQLSALDTENICWNDEEAFIEKYGKKEDADANFAELHTLLKSTVMIRRMKHDVLKTLPGKVRDNVHVQIRCKAFRHEIGGYMNRLREGKGALGKLAVRHKIRYVAEEEQQIPVSSSIGNDQKIGENGEEVSRKALLNRLYSLTGSAKVPIIVEMVKSFLSDPKNGKLCLFAHHLFVLDAVVEQCELSNLHGSDMKYIRIDGSTNPKARQEQISLFQRDPAVRIAILGITAAGVGVTLTAASTIWFAELFWTPAIMVQAEDRCHRIGQQSKVRCLYIIAKGTLDEVLFLLLQKKFRDLGEFVEGKEEMNIVINQSYRDEKHAIKSICMPPSLEENDDKADEEAGGDIDPEEQVFKSLASEDELQHVIEELAIEEQATMKNYEDDDEDNYESRSSAKPDAVASVSQNGIEVKSAAVGSSQQDAICLSDDEDEGGHSDTMEDVVPRFLSHLNPQIPSSLSHLNPQIPSSTEIPGSIYYYMYFNQPSYNFNISPFSGRYIISRSTNSSRDIQTGDFICHLNFTTFELNLRTGVEMMKNAIFYPPVRLLICRNKDFTKLFISCMMARQKFEAEETKKKFEAEKARQEAVANMHQPNTDEKPSDGVSNGAEDIIEVLD